MEVSMRKLFCVLACGLAVGVAGLSGSRAALQEKKEASNKEKVIGAWESTKSGSGIPPGSIFEFTKDGKLKIKIKQDGKEVAVEGTYTVDGDVITSAGPKGEKPDKNKIKKLTDTELITVDEQGKVDEFKRKK
jgi:uncharacterized protein (TIGR03066 family)